MNWTGLQVRNLVGHPYLHTAVAFSPPQPVEIYPLGIRGSGEGLTFCGEIAGNLRSFRRFMDPVLTIFGHFNGAARLCHEASPDRKLQDLNDEEEKKKKDARQNVCTCI